MQIQAVHQYSPKKQTNFKSAYPVYHWVSDMGSKYSLAVTKDLNETLNGAVVRLANRKTPAKNQAINELAIKVQRFFMKHDFGFKRNLISRSFYNGNQAYIITGDDVAIFDSNFAKNIGKAKALTDGQSSAELNIALGDYYTKGLTFVKNKSNQFMDRNGQKYALHTQFNVERTKTGNIKGYKLVSARYLPVDDLEKCSEKINAK